MASTTKILSWEGYETQKEKLQNLTEKYRGADMNLGSCNSMVEAWKNPSSKDSDLAKAAAKAFSELVYYKKYLCEQGFNYHLVRDVSSVILNPHPSEIARCEQNIHEERRKAGLVN